MNSECYEEEEYFHMPDLLMYKLTNCGNYIIYDQNLTYHILSRSKKWKSILTSDRLPCVNPFYTKIHNRILMDIFTKLSE